MAKKANQCAIHDAYTDATAKLPACEMAGKDNYQNYLMNNKTLKKVIFYISLDFLTEWENYHSVFH